ncbi:MAG: bifunctional diaminohydroxyphosphoribosylaminopyrimidine deaminase/5-amino-6-(5-phosphoribosylamino)uracil reductase RibD [Pseudomonadota bacterium]
MHEADTRFLKLALALARQGDGTCWPNPSVGCVIVKDDRIVGRGRTAPGGRPHAERMALDQAGQAAQGATAYVSLEPCSHHGQTPPCANALIEAGIARVVAPVEDPHPNVSGAGFDALRAAGVTVETGLLAEEAEDVLSGFLMRVQLGRPWVTLKLATSFDGRIATASGHSQWITGPEARRWVHAMRARHDAVMVGAGTVRADDPSLTVRDLGVAHQPVRVAVSRRLDLPLMSNLARTAREVPVWLCHGPDADASLIEAWTGVGAELLTCQLTGRQLNLSSVLMELGQKGLTRVLCEGGGALAASLLAEGLVDELVGFTAGFAIGAEGRPGVGALGLDRLDNARRFRLVASRNVGGDAMHRWVAQNESE